MAEKYQVRHRGLTVLIRKVTAVKNAVNYPGWEILDYSSGKRVRHQRSTLEEAKAKAREVCECLVTNKREVLEWDERQRFANYLLRAWQLSFESDGIYGFGCCKQAKSVAGFFRWLEREDGKSGIIEDVESRFDSYWSCEEEWLLRSLRKVCHDNEVIKNVFADELGQINKQMKAANEAEDKRSAEAEKQQEQADKQAEAERLARIENPSGEDVKSALGTVLQAYRLALGICEGLSPSLRRVEISCKVLLWDSPALREWYEQ